MDSSSTLADNFRADDRLSDILGEVNVLYYIIK